MSTFHQPFSYPPHRTDLSTSTRASLADALATISNYLDASTMNPALHPDALLTESGPQYASSSATGGIVLSLLRRLEKGLNGERMGGDVTLQGMLPVGDGARLDDGRTRKRKRMEEDDGGEEGRLADGQGGEKFGDAPTEEGVEDGNTEGEWQDMESYQRSENGVQQGEIGPRSNAVQNGGEVPEVMKDKKRTNWTGSNVDGHQSSNVVDDVEKMHESRKRRMEGRQPNEDEKSRPSTATKDSKHVPKVERYKKSKYATGANQVHVPNKAELVKDQNHGTGPSQTAGDTAKAKRSRKATNPITAKSPSPGKGMVDEDTAPLKSSEEPKHKVEVDTNAERHVDDKAQKKAMKEERRVQKRAKREERARKRARKEEKAQKRAGKEEKAQKRARREEKAQKRARKEEKARMKTA